MPAKSCPGYFYLPKLATPTVYNLREQFLSLGWKASYWPWRAHFSMKNLRFPEQAAQTLEFKHLLAGLVNKYCPEVMPLTYVINDDNWTHVLYKLAKQPQSWQNRVWILKPSLLNNGQHIHIFNEPGQIVAHFSHHQRLGGEHVLQQYINNPQLLRDNRKYSIRMFVILTSYNGAFLYPYGYYNVAQHPYTAQQFVDLRPHLTNEHLFASESNVLQIPSSRFADFPAHYQQITQLSTRLLQAFSQQYPGVLASKKRPTLALFGFDFLVDSGGRVWLLETNHGPCFPVEDSHPLQKHLYQDFWPALMHYFILPIAQRRAGMIDDYGPFLPLIPCPSRER